MSTRRAVFSLMIILILYVQYVKPNILVHTEVGSIKGVPADDGDYVMFLGIPYAKVNSSNPFGASIPYPRFEKVFEANDDTVVCPQLLEYKKYEFTGVVDCLQMNVYVPNTDNNKKAVLIYIYGGKNVVGTKEKALLGCKYLLRHDIVVVILNYRLGSYGFLCTDHPEVPGNQGLKDQYQAIKWIKHNIQAFGGDPQKITLGGHSSGSICVDAHLLTKQPRLFQQAILQSGTATYPSMVKPPNTTKLFDISDRLGLKTNDVPTAVKFLSKLDPESVVRVHTSMRWGPCIEHSFEEVFTFIDEVPEESEARNVDNMNILGGFTTRESMVYAIITYKDMVTNPNVFQFHLNLKFDLENSNYASTIIKRFYYGDDSYINETYFTPSHQVEEFLSDFYFVHPMQRALIKYSKHKNTKIYLYMFSYNGKRNLGKVMHSLTTEFGTAHCDENGYIFSNFVFDSNNLNEEDETLIDRMTALWTNFVKYGNPTPHTTELVPTTWPQLTANTMPCLQIDSNSSVISRPFRKNMAFWDLFFEANSHKIKFKNVKEKKVNHVPWI